MAVVIKELFFVIYCNILIVLYDIIVNYIWVVSRWQGYSRVQCSTVQ